MCALGIGCWAEGFSRFESRVGRVEWGRVGKMGDVCSVMKLAGSVGLSYQNLSYVRYMEL